MTVDEDIMDIQRREIQRINNLRRPGEINIRNIRWLTGGDRIMPGRGLYREHPPVATEIQRVQHKDADKEVERVGR